jgi:hypothetical protein
LACIENHELSIYKDNGDENDLLPTF